MILHSGTTRTRPSRFLKEATLLKTEVEGHETLVRKADDLIDYLDMAMEDGDASFAADIEKQYNDLLRDIEKREVLLLLSGEYDNCNTITFHAGAGGANPGLGADADSHVYPLGPNGTVIN